MSYLDLWVTEGRIAACTLHLAQQQLGHSFLHVGGVTRLLFLLHCF